MVGTEDYAGAYEKLLYDIKPKLKGLKTDYLLTCIKKSSIMKLFINIFMSIVVQRGSRGEFRRQKYTK